MPQLDYSAQAPAFAGMQADLTQGALKDTMVQGEASAEIAFGRFVCESVGMTGAGNLTTNPAGTPAVAILPVDANSDFGNGGIVLHAHDYDKRLELGDTGLKPKTLMTVLKRGRAWVYGEVAMAKTDSVFVRYTAAGGNVVGNFRNDADTAKAIQIYGARVVTPSAAAGLFEVEIDMAAHRAH